MPAAVAHRARLHPIVVGVRRADPREHRPARLQVVVVAAHPSRGEPRGLVRCEEAERAGDLEARLGVYGVDRLEDPAQEPLLGVADRDHDAELGGASRSRGPRRRHHLLEVEERVDVDVGVKACRLGAERAVLGACTRLGVDEALQLDGRAAVRQPDLVSERHQIRQDLEGEAGDRRDVLTVESLASIDEPGLGSGQGVRACHRAQSVEGARPPNDPSVAFRGGVTRPPVRHWGWWRAGQVAANRLDRSEERPDSAGRGAG